MAKVEETSATNSIKNLVWYDKTLLRKKKKSLMFWETQMLSWADLDKKIDTSRMRLSEEW